MMCRCIFISVVLFFLLVHPAQAQQGQYRRPVLYLTSFAITGEDGKILISDDLEQFAVEVLGDWDFNGIISSDSHLPFQYYDENDREPGLYESFGTQPADRIFPFPAGYMMFSGNHHFRELRITRYRDGDQDTMFIIFHNNIVTPDSAHTNLFILDPVPFKTGVYELDARKNVYDKKNLWIEDSVRMNAWYIKTALIPKQKIKISTSVLQDYLFNGYHFEENGKFRYENYQAGHDTRIVGEGTWALRKNTLRLQYGKVPPRENLVSIIPAEKDSFPCCRIRFSIADPNGNPLPGVTLFVKESHTGAATDDSGIAFLRIQKQQFPVTIQFYYVGFPAQEIKIIQPSGYQFSYTFPALFQYIDSGTVQTGIFTDLEKDYTGIYWYENPDSPETFSNQHTGQWGQRVIYYRKGYFRRPVVIPD